MSNLTERMNARIIIQKDDVLSDQYGNHIKGWTNYHRCWSDIVTAQKAENGVIIRDDREIICELRYCAKTSVITSDKFRVIFHDEIYNIVSVDMMNYKRKTIKLKCQKVER